MVRFSCNATDIPNHGKITIWPPTATKYPAMMFATASIRLWVRVCKWLILVWTHGVFEPPVRYLYRVKGDVRPNLPMLEAMRTLEVVEEVPIEMTMRPAGTMDIAAHIGALPLNPYVRLAVKQRRFNV